MENSLVLWRHNFKKGPGVALDFSILLDESMILHEGIILHEGMILYECIILHLVYCMTELPKVYWQKLQY